MERQEQLAAAHQAHDARRFAAAAAHYRAFVTAGGAMGDVGVALGDVLTESGDFAAALEAYAAAVQADESNLLAAVRLGQAAQRIGRFDVARAAWRRGAEHAGADLDVFVGGELPLPESLDVPTAEPPPRLAWPAPSGRTPPPAVSARFADLPVMPSALRLVALDPPASPDRPGLITSVRLEEPTDEALRRAAEIGERLDPGRAVVIAHIVGAANRGRMEALRHLVRARRMPVRFAVHEAGASVRAMWNLDLALAVESGADVLLFDRVPEVDGADFSGVFQADPQVGFASWRSHEALWAGEATCREEKWRYGPMQTGDVTLVRNRVLLEAGILDSVYEDHTQALLDLMLRSNRMGFTGVSAPVPHAPASSRRIEPGGDPVDARISASRHPEHRDALRRASISPAREVERLSIGLRRPRSLALDLSGLRAWHDGTSELSVELARALAKRARFDLTAICTPEAARHHGLDDLAGLTVAPPQTRAVFGACLKVGQPFTWRDVLRTWSFAPVAGFYMLDAISMDVERLDIADLETLWRIALGVSELTGHLSQFTRDQMGERFGQVGRRGFVALCSTAADEYGRHAPSQTGDGPILLIGNAYEHKNLVGAVRRIHAREPTRELKVLGRVMQSRPHVTWIDSGGLTRQDLGRLYEDAAAVVFPSLYEGFGLPIMHGLARGKPVLAIDQPVFREIKARSALGANLHLFPTTQSLAEGLAAVCRAGFSPPVTTVREHRWSDAARIIEEAVKDATNRFDPSALEHRAAVAHLSALSDRETRSSS